MSTRYRRSNHDNYKPGVRMKEDLEGKGRRYEPDVAIDIEGSDRWDTPRILSAPVTIAIGVFAAGVGSLLIWSVVYKLPVYAEGSGILFNGNRLFGVRAQLDGIVKSVNTGINQKVYKGKELAYLYLEDDEARRNAALIELEGSKRDHRLASRLIPGELERQIKANEVLLRDTKENIRKQKVVLVKQQTNLKTYIELEKKGYLSEVELLQYQEKAIELENTIGKTESTLISLIATRDKTIRELNEALNEATKSLARDKASLTVQKNRVEAGMKLYSPVTGTVVQITALPGNTVSKGEELFVVSGQGKKLRGAFLMKSKDGGKARRGDKVLISPTSAPAQRYGYIQGTVVEISPYPTNIEAYSSRVGSESLAKSVFEYHKDEAPVLVVADIAYKGNREVWIGSKGPEWGVSSGTTAKIKVVYEERRPITYVIPWIRKVTGVDNF